VATVEDEIRATLDALVEAANTGEDVEGFYARDVPTLVIGSAEEEWGTVPEMLDAIRGQAASGLRIVPGRDLTVQVVADGVAWAAGRFRFRDPEGNERPARWSATLVRQDEAWRIAHSHVSVGVPDAELFAR